MDMKSFYILFCINFFSMTYFAADLSLPLVRPLPFNPFKTKSITVSTVTAPFPSGSSTVNTARHSHPESRRPRVSMDSCNVRSLTFGEVLFFGRAFSRAFSMDWLDSKDIW